MAKTQIPQRPLQRNQDAHKKSNLAKKPEQRSGEGKRSFGDCNK
jgi:hypothetical protein